MVVNSGLEYLHHGCKPPIIHRDVKTTNILLNEKFRAKIADFGLSRDFPTESGTHVSTVVAGTRGYLDPECINVTYRLTEKSDVYSFGVVLIQIITSRPVFAKINDHEKSHISGWVELMVESGKIEEIVDPRLQGDFYLNSAWKAVETASACLRSSRERPTMNEVVIELKGCLAMETASNKNGGRRNESNHSSMSMDSGLTPSLR